MNSSEPACREAGITIARITALLDESLLARVIDQPIDNAVETFPCGIETPESHLQMHDVITDFVVHMRARTAPLGSKSSRERVRDEAVDLLEQGYSDFRP